MLSLLEVMMLVMSPYLWTIAYQITIVSYAYWYSISILPDPISLFALHISAHELRHTGLAE